MRVTIYGLTDATIRLNKIGITMHGKEAAKHIDILNSDQESELRELMAHGLVRVRSDEPEVEKPNLLVTEKKAEKVEEEPKKPKKRGRPKGSKNKKETPKEEDTSENEAIEQAAAAAAAALASETEEKVVVGTDSGSVKTSTKNRASGEIAESEATKASIEAMKKLEAEEAGEDIEDIPVIDEDDLDPSEKMGMNATMITGKGIEQKPMVNSILPDPNMIDPDPLADGVKPEVEADEEYEEGEFDPFIDDEVNELQDESDKEKDPFIEI